MTAQELESATARALELLQDYCRIIKNDKMLYSAASAALGMGSALPDTPVGNAKLVQFVERALWLLRHGSNMGHAMMAIFATDIYHRLVRVTRRGLLHRKTTTTGLLDAVPCTATIPRERWRST